jgi:hypothetical protein
MRKRRGELRVQPGELRVPKSQPGELRVQPARDLLYTSPFPRTFFFACSKSFFCSLSTA